MAEHGSGATYADSEAVARVALGDAAELLVYDAPPADDRLRAADLFNTPAYFGLHAGGFARAFYFVARHPVSLAPFAVAQFAEVEPGHFRSPGRGSYGGVQLLAAKVEVALVEALVDAIGGFLGERGAGTVTVVLPPFDYSAADTSLVAHVMMRAGFRLAGHELNYAMRVSGSSLLPRMDHGNRKRVQAAQRLGLRFHHLAPEQLPDAYAVVAENRAKRGYTLSMSLDALAAMAQALPGRVRCFGVRLDAELIAAAVCVEVSRDVLYVFYWGELPGVERLSPVAYLASELYTVCVREDRRLLDIGTATLAGVPNHGLIRFKKNLGCRESMKLTLVRTRVAGAVP